jgi:hypothetical protein
MNVIIAITVIVLHKAHMCLSISISATNPLLNKLMTCGSLSSESAKGYSGFTRIALQTPPCV